MSIVGALILPLLLGMSGLALEYGSALLTKVETQRVADLAAVAGASAYGRNQSLSDATRAAESVAVLNGVARTRLVVTLEPLPAAPGDKAARATITTQQTLLLARVLNAQQYLDVTVAALAGTMAGKPACIQALDRAGSGVTLSGGTSVSTVDCIVASSARVTAPCGTMITTPTVNYDSASAPAQCSNNLRAPDGGAANLVKGPTPDPLAGTESVALAAARIASAAALSAPIVPVGGDMSFGWDQVATKAQATAVGCSASFSGSTWAFTCPGKTTVNLGSITLGGGLTLGFGYGGAATTVYNVSGRIENGGSAMRFAPGVYNIAKGIIVPGGTRTEFGGGSFRVGPAAGGNAVTVSGGATLILGDPLAAGGTFEIAGNVVTEGGSCLTFGAAPNHGIMGFIRGAGGIVFGAGVYEIDGYLHLGAASGGSVFCNGATVSFRASDATIILSGRGVPASGDCAGQAFCATAGYSDIRLQAPGSGPFAKLALIGPTNPAVRSGASFQSGASGGRISGTFYFPNGLLNLSGGASVSGGTGTCLQLIGASVNLAGGATAATMCIGPGAVAAGGVRLLE
ncbi:pilus assembly protein TadG-related protein [Paracoccaceae bacterium Fryx2]|nr:pilus assembly protein TadG-related protein [Paracoccaceae bacterium Fryx2]